MHPGFIGARRRVGRGAHAKDGGGAAVRSSSPAALRPGPDGPHTGSWPGPGRTGSGWLLSQKVKHGRTKESRVHCQTLVLGNIGRCAEER
jgi:hypothetical protein